MKKIFIYGFIITIVSSMSILLILNIFSNSDDSSDFYVEQNTSNSALNTQAIKIIDDDFIEYISSSTEEYTEITKEEYIYLTLENKLKIDSPIFFYDDTMTVVYAGVLEILDGKYYLRRACIDELYSDFNYTAGTNNNSRSNNNSFKISNNFTTNAYYKKSTSSLTNEYTVKSAVNIDVEIENLLVNISINPLKNKYQFSIDYDYDIDFALKSILEFKCEADVSKSNEIKSSLGISSGFQNEIDSLYSFDTSIGLEGEFLSLESENKLNFSYYPANETGISGIDKRTFELVVGYIELPPACLYGFEQLINQLITIPIKVYFDIDGNASLGITNELIFNRVGNMNCSFDNSRNNKFQSKDETTFAENIISLIVEGNMTADIKAGVTLQLNILGFKGLIGKGGLDLLEVTTYCNLLLHGNAKFIAARDFENNNDLVYFEGTIKMSISFNVDAGYAFELKFLFINFKSSLTINILKLKLPFDVLSTMNTDFMGSSFCVWHDGKKIAPEDFSKYNVSFNGLLDKFNVDEDTKKDVNDSYDREELKGIDTSVLYSNGISILTEGELYEYGTLEIAIDVNNPLEFDISLIVLNVYGQDYTFEMDDFIYYSSNRVVVTLTLQQVSSETDELQITLNKVNFYNADLNLSVTNKNIFSCNVNVVSYGDGSESNPIKIFTAEDFARINENTHAILMNDIDFNEFDSFECISNYNAIFNGNNFTIKNLRLNDSSKSSLFDIVRENGVIKNINFEDVVSYSDNESSILCFENYGLISDIKLNNTNSKSDTQTGLISIFNYSIIKNIEINNCYLQNNNTSVGGLATFNYGVIEDVKINKSKISGNNLVGGICSTNGVITKNSIIYTGVIINCTLSDTTIYATNTVGGIAAKNERGASIRNCNLFSLKLSANRYVGGVVGYNNSTISDCNVTSSMLICDDYVGGIAGYSDVSDVYSITTVSYSGTIIANSYAGGIIGYLKYGKVFNYLVLELDLITTDESTTGNFFGEIGRGVII